MKQSQASRVVQKRTPTPGVPFSSSSSVSSPDDRGSSSGSNLTSPVVYSPLAISHNHHLAEYCRTSMSALAGCTAGIIGLTSLQGFAFYFIILLIFWVMLLGKAGGANWKRYFTSPYGLLTNGFIGGLTTYVLFWTFLYGMVHVY